MVETAFMKPCYTTRRAHRARNTTWPISLCTLARRARVVYGDIGPPAYALRSAFMDSFHFPLQQHLGVLSLISVDDIVM